MGKIKGEKSAKYGALGATLGSVFPGVGTAVGGATGAVIGVAEDILTKDNTNTPSPRGSFPAYRRKTLTREIIEQEVLKGGLYNGQSKRHKSKSRKKQ